MPPSLSQKLHLASDIDCLNPHACQAQGTLLEGIQTP